MIVNFTDTGWEVIYHRAHALLAAQIAGNWQTPDDASQLVDTVAAIMHHDDLEREWEGDSLTQSGAPLDFTLQSSLSVPQLYRHIEGALYRGRWVALLVSMHSCFLNQSKRGQCEELDQFLDKQAELQKAWRRSLKVNKTDAEKAYAMMQCCDRLSLILCQRQLPEGERFLEISKGPTGEQHDILKRPDHSLLVKSWPFKVDNFTVRVDAAYLTQMKFDSSEELSSVLRDAPMQSIEWNFVR